MNSNALQYRSLLRDELEGVRAAMLASCTRIPVSIRAAVEALIVSKGKFLRPALVILSSHLHGAEHRPVVYAAAAIEMLHTATLIHDDLIDGAILRRGVSTLNAEHGPGVTVLAGDIVFALAAELIAQTEHPRLIRRFAENLNTICTGELDQMFSGNGGTMLSEAAYYDRIYAKTASLFALCVESGALLSDKPEDEIARATDFGRQVGEAFQITDDLLDFTGNPARLGKPVGSDLRHGLVTLPVLHYYTTHSTDARLAAWLKGARDEACLDSLIADLQTSDAFAWTKAQAQKRVDDALKLLETYSPSPYRDAMAEIAQFAVQRRV